MKRYACLTVLSLLVVFGCGPGYEQNSNEFQNNSDALVDASEKEEKLLLEYSINGSSQGIWVPKQSSNFDISSIYGIKFFLSFEESSDDGVVFRPGGYEFPPSYPRPGFKFDADGKYMSYQPATDDSGTVPESALTWKQLGESNWFQILRDGKPEKVIILMGGPEKITRQTLMLCIFPSTDPKCLEGIKPKKLI